MEVTFSLPYDLPEIGRAGDRVLVRDDETLEIFLVRDLPAACLDTLMEHASTLKPLSVHRPDLRRLLLLMAQRHQPPPQCVRPHLRLIR